MSDTIYPPPRWFKDAVRDWLDAHTAAALPHRIGDLFTRITRAQPPDLRVVADSVSGVQEHG